MTTRAYLSEGHLPGPWSGIMAQHNMDYTIEAPDSTGREEVNEIYALKLTDDIFAKLCQGQSDLNNLKGVSFTVSATCPNVRALLSVPLINHPL